MRLPLSFTLLLGLASCAPEPDASQDSTPESQSSALYTGPVATGIWYSTWYANEGRYIWSRGHGVGSSAQMLGDVNGDGRADAVVYFSSSGDWYVATSNGNGFNSYTRWISGHGVGSSTQMLGDVNGDGRADAIVYFSAGGDWYVSTSSGSAFNPYSRWISGHGVGSSAQRLADVNGDRKVDAIVYFSAGGDWYVSTSSGSAFNPYSRWISGHGVGSNAQMLGDVNGDGRADAVTYIASTGDWYVATSSGSGFNPYSRWSSGHGIGSSAQRLGDTNGDGRADAVAYFSSGEWKVATSSGSGFNAYSLWSAGHGAGSNTQFLGDAYGKGRVAPVTFTAADGTWRVLDSSKYLQPNIMNTWEAWDIRYLPRTHGVYQVYDSKDATVIDEHLATIESAKIDFLLLDETNNLDVDQGYIKARALEVCARIGQKRSAGALSTPRYAIAIGGIQFDHQPATLELEAAKVWNEFVQSAKCVTPDGYFQLDGKPLLVVYAEYADRLAWESWTGSKTASSRFTVRWAQGSVRASSTQPPQRDRRLYYGWGMPDGALANDEVMVVMSGWNNHRGWFVSRTYNGVRGGFYQQLGWSRVNQQRPRLAIINSFNEYAEETAVAPTDTSGLTGTSEKWLDAQGNLAPDMYWNMTVQANATRKQ
ncbi:FG-GAP-like repeat-containing protein [Myxococcus virescens]|uniref:FG-GAP-like repeat-containing protein n=1 Tax=Myxococcus virescens TaxID=83456 RepID=UPI003DA51C7A